MSTFPPDTPLCVWQGPREGYYFAHGQCPSGHWLVKVTPNGATVQRASANRITQAMGEYLRKGYVRTRATMYFDAAQQKLNYTHPDISWGGKSWVLAAQPPSLPEGGEAVATMLRNVPVNVLTPEEIDAWAQRQQINTKYLVAFNDDPSFSLSLATQALRQGWIMRCHPDLGPPPRQPIEASFAEWDVWLGQVFSISRVQEVRLALGLHSMPSLVPPISTPSSFEAGGDDSCIGIFT